MVRLWSFVRKKHAQDTAESWHALSDWWCSTCRRLQRTAPERLSTAYLPNLDSSGDTARLTRSQHVRASEWVANVAMPVVTCISCSITDVLCYAVGNS